LITKEVLEYFLMSLKFIPTLCSSYFLLPLNSARRSFYAVAYTPHLIAPA